MPDKKDDISEDELDQIIQDMSKEEVVEPTSQPPLTLVQGKKGNAKTETPSCSSQALTLEMNGVINLRLCFKNGERNIEVICSDEALICRMADGTEFKIPTGYGKAHKAA